MKKVLYSAMLLATVLAGCTKESYNDSIISEPIPEKPGYSKVTIYADAVSDETKTSYADDQNFSWVSGDKISVLYTDSSNNPQWVEFTAQSTAKKSAFVAEIPDGYTMGAPSTHTWWALYPASNQHVYTSDSNIGFYFASVYEGNTANIPMIGKLESGSTYRFRHLCGAAKFTVSNIRTEVTRLKLTVDASWNGNIGGGVFTIQDPSSSAPYINKSNIASGGTTTTSAIANVNPSTHSATVFVPLIVGTIWPSYRVYAYDASNDILLATGNASKEGEQLVINRGQINRVNRWGLADVDRSKLIQVDGYFSDWGSATGVVSKSWSGSQVFDMKVVSDGTNIWFYHKVYGDKVQLDYSGYIELFMDTDGDSATGDTGKWFANGVERDLVYYYSTSVGIPRSSFNFVRWENYDSGTSSWSTGGDSPSVSWSAYQDPVSKDMTFEWGTTLAAMGLTPGNTVRFGFVLRKPELTSNNNLLSYTIPMP